MGNRSPAGLAARRRIGGRRAAVRTCAMRGNGAAARTISGPRQRSRQSPHRTNAAEWKQSLANCATRCTPMGRPSSSWPAGREVLYVVDAPRTLEGHGLTIEVTTARERKDGNWGKPKRQAITADEISHLPDPATGKSCHCCSGQSRPAIRFRPTTSPSYDYYGSAGESFQVRSTQSGADRRRMCDTGRGHGPNLSGRRSIRHSLGRHRQMGDVGRPPERSSGERQHLVLTGELRRGEKRMELYRAERCSSPGGMVFWQREESRRWTTAARSPGWSCCGP